MREKKYKRYVRMVLDKKLNTCDATYKAVQRHVRDMENTAHEYEFSEKEADKVIEFIETLELFEGKFSGQKFLLDDYQAFIIASIFGWISKADKKKRRYKKAFISMGRGNGKTPLAAAMSFIALLKDHGAQIYSIANAYTQAAISLNWVKNFVSHSPELSELIKIYDKAVFFEKKFSTFKALSRSFKGFDGFNPSFVIADEVAAMDDYNLINVMETAMHKRDDSLLVMITTANTASLTSPGLAEYDYAKKILDGVVKNERYFAIIYEMDKDDDWKNSRLYAKANPASWLDIQELKDAKLEAESNKIKEKSFRTKNLNQWKLGANDEWIPLQVWDRAIQNHKEHGKLKLEGRPCAIGADFSERRDLTVYTLAFWIRELNKVYLKHKAFIPEETLHAREKNENALYSEWIRTGQIVLCNGEYIDREQVCDEIATDIALYKPQLFGYDPYMSHEYVEILQDKIQMVPIPQDMRTFSPATLDFEELIRQGNIIDGSEVMRWCMSNAVLYQSSKLVKVQKCNKDSPKRIDLVVSSIMAYSQLKIIADQPQAPQRDMKALRRLLYG